MRRTLGAVQRSPIGVATYSLSLRPFSSATGRGRGRGRGVSSPVADDVPVNRPGLGHGRGIPLPTASPPISAGRGRAQATPPSGPKKVIPSIGTDPTPTNNGDVAAQPGEITPRITDFLGDMAVRKELHLGIESVLSGAGRGKPVKESGPSDRKPVEDKVENRHLRAKQTVISDADKEKEKDKAPKLSREEAVRKALGILSKGDGMGEGESRMMDDGGGRGGRGGFRGRSGRGMRGRGGGRGRWEGGRGGRDSRDKDDDHGSGLYLGNEADGEKLAEKLGPEKMAMLAEAFDEMSARVLPSPADDAYIDALHTNMMIECEPEYLMEEFGTNPDIDDTPPIPLRDALEKMKPFLMAYEGIRSHEEWEEIIEETMKNVPLMKEIVDHYSGPDRVTAKQQQQELQRVANTLPEKTHASIKRFTDRAMLSLQSNPGWGFDKKCQFMDKLVREVSQRYP